MSIAPFRIAVAEPGTADQANVILTNAKNKFVAAIQARQLRGEPVLSNTWSDEARKAALEARQAHGGVPHFSKWSAYAGGTMAAEGKHGYSFTHPTNGKQYNIDPISSEHGRHLGYGLRVFPSDHYGHAGIDRNGDEGYVGFRRGNLFAHPQEASAAANKHAAKRIGNSSAPGDVISNAGTSEGIKKGWLTRHGLAGVRNYVPSADALSDKQIHGAFNHFHKAVASGGADAMSVADMGREFRSKGYAKGMEGNDLARHFKENYDSMKKKGGFTVGNKMSNAAAKPRPDWDTDQDAVICEDCDGTGIDDDGTVCDECDGDGWIDDDGDADDNVVANAGTSEGVRKAWVTRKDGSMVVAKPSDAIGSEKIKAEAKARFDAHPETAKAEVQAVRARIYSPEFTKLPDSERIRLNEISDAYRDHIGKPRGDSYISLGNPAKELSAARDFANFSGGKFSTQKTTSGHGYKVFASGESYGHKIPGGTENDLLKHGEMIHHSFPNLKVSAHGIGTPKSHLRVVRADKVSNSDSINFIDKHGEAHEKRLAGRVSNSNMANDYGMAVNRARAKGVVARMNNEHYPWDKCISDNAKHGKDRAAKICGSIKAKYGNAAVTNIFTKKAKVANDDYGTQSGMPNGEGMMDNSWSDAAREAAAAARKAKTKANEAWHSGKASDHMAAANAHSQAAQGAAHTQNWDSAREHRQKEMKHLREHAVRAKGEAMFSKIFRMGKMGNADVYQRADELLSNGQALPKELADELEAERELDFPEAISNAGTSEGVKKGWETRKGSILPIGAVNLKTGGNKLFGNIWHGWDEGKGSNLLMGHISGGDKLRAVHTADDFDSVKANTPVGTPNDPSGTIYDLHHDQTGSHLGGWHVKGVYPHTKEGMEKMRQDAQKNSIPFSTFK